MVTYVYWVLMPAGSSTGSAFHPTEPAGTEIFKVVAGSAVDEALQNGGTVEMDGKQWQPYMVGSFPTQAAAKAASPPSGLGYIGTVLGAGAGALSGAGGVVNPGLVGSASATGGAVGQAAQNTFGALETFFGDLTQRNTWLRVLKFIAGVGLALLGVAHLVHAGRLARTAAGVVPV